MFKIESYVTPILLSYVDKYVRDFKPADAQVSLWGGGVVLHNLVLKADVLQQEVALPFTLVSGRIHELLINVPWTKIMSEPIVVTIDTIECVLSLTPPTPAEESQLPEQNRRTQVVEAPPGYMQALVRRIVSNIALRVHHLIVKYVQDDIVLSLNVKHLSVDCAGVNWEPAFADIDQNDPVIRRLVRLDDLTLCLDRADSDGKIRFYQEPLLYRCQLDLRVLTQLVSANTRRASRLSIHLRSSKLAWGVTSDQVVLLLRMTRERPPVEDKPTPPQPKASAPPQPMHATSVNSAEPARQGSWSEWAWSWLPAWADREGTAEEATTPATPIPVRFIAYFDEVSLVFKVMELESGVRKRARGVLELTATHAAIKSAVRAPTLAKVNVGLRTLALTSRGKCVCGHLGLDASKDQPSIYLRKSEHEEGEAAWAFPDDDLKDDTVELAQVADEELRKTPYTSSQFRSATDQASVSQVNESQPEEAAPASEEEMDELWRKMAPVVYVEFTHERAPPDAYTNPYDNPPKDFQYSDWAEVCSMKVTLQPLELRVCMELLHRLTALQEVFAELPPLEEQELSMRTLTVEECDALLDNLPQRRITIEAKGLRVRLVPWDHSMTERPCEIPVTLDLEVPKALFVVTGPLYPHRVCSAACQLPKDSGPLWNGARLHVSGSISSLQAQLNSPTDTQPRPCARSDLKFVLHSLLNKPYFRSRESVVTSYSVKIREANICGSFARLQAAWHVLNSLLSQRVSVYLKYTTLARDALADEESVAIDLTFEELSLRGYLTEHINTHILSMQSARATAYHAPTKEGDELKQAWLFAAPDTPTTTPYLRSAIQWCKIPIPNGLDYVGMWTEPISFCADPLLIAWLAYKPTLKPYTDYQPQTSSLKSMSSTQYFLRRRTPPSSSGKVTASRTGSGAELVHVRPRSVASSSEPSDKREQKRNHQTQSSSSSIWYDGEALVKLHERLRYMLVNLEVGLVLLYVSSATASALDCATVRDAMERHAAAVEPVLVMSMGRLLVHSSTGKKHLWQEIRHDGPTFYADETPKTSTTVDESFPWRMRLADMSCYTLEVRVRPEGEELRSQLKMNHALPKTMLEMITTTVTLSVVTRTRQLQIQTGRPKDVKQESKETSIREDKIKYFTTGVDFKPTTLKEFFRGPATRLKVAETQTTEAPVELVRPSTINGPVVSLGVHLHADTPPLVLRLEHEQVHLIASALHGLKHIVTLLQRPPISPPKHSSQHRPMIRSVSEIEEVQSRSEETPTESRSGLISIYESRSAMNLKLKTFYWFQWVISRATLVIASQNVKLVFDVDDIISTVDLQAHYNQLKVKIASASVRHYERTGSTEWTAGVLGGRVLEAREPIDAKEENHFITVTVTQAQISNLPATWKEELHPKLLEQKMETDSMWEIYATLAPLEAVIQPTILENVVSLLHMFAPRAFCMLSTEVEERPADWQFPFVYVNAGGLRLLITSEDEDNDADDTFIISFEKVTVNPHPENPICRRAVGAATDTSWLGSSGPFEGRQYELLVKNFGIRTSQFSQLVYQEASQKEMMQGTDGPAQNPALKWNQPIVSPVILPMLHLVDINCVLAPAMYHNGSLVCGPAVEFNLISDCTLQVSVEQLALLQRVLVDVMDALAAHRGSGLKNKGEEKCPYATLLMNCMNDDLPSLLSDSISNDETLKGGEECVGRVAAATDSGVDTAASHSSVKSGPRDDHTGPKKSVSIVFLERMSDASDYLEVFVTMGTIELSLLAGDDNSPEIIALRPPLPTTQDTPLKVEIIFEKSDAKTKDEEAADSLNSGNKLTEAERLHMGPAKSVVDLKQEIQSQAHRRIESNLPLLHVMLQQPNLYYWRRKTLKNLQVSLFNAWVGLGSSQSSTQWSAPLLSTARGAPDPSTDIPPALATMKASQPAGGSNVKGNIKIDIERPVQLEVCTDRVRRLTGILALIRDKISRHEDIETPVVQLPFLFRLRRFMIQHAIESVTVQTSQLALSGSEGAVGCAGASLQLAAGARPDRLCGRALATALLVAAGPPQDRRHVMLQPMTLGVDMEAVWETWRRAEGGATACEPTVRLSVDLDRVTIDLRPAELAAASRIRETLLALSCKKMNNPPGPTSRSKMIFKRENSRASTLNFMHRLSSNTNNDQDPGDHYYKDDLRSGAFKIVSGGQLPMAYQVTLHGPAVAWRYPHPRAITRIVAFPLPEQEHEIECVLELYSPMLQRWHPHTYFKLPLGGPREIQLCASAPDTVFAQMWRFRACVENEPTNVPFEFNIQRFLPKTDPLLSEVQPEMEYPPGQVPASAEQLSSAVRVDSYFAPRVLPRLRFAARLASLELHVQNSLPNLSSQVAAMEGFYVSKPLLRSHRVLTLTARDVTAHAQLGSPAGYTAMLDANVSGDILDCATGTMEQLLDEFQLQSAISVPECDLQRARARAFATTVHVALHVPRLRTLHALANDWQAAAHQYMRTSDSSESVEAGGVESRSQAEATVAALHGRVSLWVHNTCGFSLRVGQEGTDEVVPLGPGVRLAYRWQSPTAVKRLRLALAGPTADWHWSSSIPFTAGSYRVRLEDAEELGSSSMAGPGGGVYAHVRVDELGSRRTMLLGGRLMLANMLRDSLLYKVRAQCSEMQWRTICAGELEHETIGSNVIAGADCEMVLKIKFADEDTGWSGDIPLKECPKENVPWLVKVPSEGDVPYISVWCRVVRARSDGRLLATVWPLYVLHSHLPLDTDVLIVSQTPSTFDHSDETQTTPYLVQVAPGRGTSTHLVAPGTTAARHELSFQYRNLNCPVTREAIPMHYGVTETSVFDKRSPINTIEEVVQETLTWLDRSSVDAISQWPYSLVAKHWPDTWQPSLVQPRCDVTVRYEAVRAGGGCSLELQLCPRVLLCNAAPVALTLRAHDAAPLCKLEPGAAISPPTVVLKKPFFISVELGRETFVSGQLLVSDATPGRYSAPSPGHLTLDRACHFAIHCNYKVALLTMYYEIKHEINVLGICTTFELINRLNMDILVSAIAVPTEAGAITDFKPKTLKLVKPTKSGSIHGLPLCRFYLRGPTPTRQRGGIDPAELAPYLCVSLPGDGHPAGTAVPVRLGQPPLRRAVALTDADNRPIPVVVTQLQLDGRWLVCVARDPCPQLLVHNRSQEALALGQPCSPHAEPPAARVTVVPECAGVRWWCTIPAGAVTHYSSPDYCARYPPPTTGEPLKSSLQFLTLAREDESEEYTWSAPVAVADGEQLVQLSGGFTVKLRVCTHPHSSLLELLDVDQNDISASDIRRRLLLPNITTENLTLTDLRKDLLEKSCSLTRTDADEKLLESNRTSQASTESFPKVVEPDAVEPDAVEPDAAKPDAVEPNAVEPDAVQPNPVEPDAATLVVASELSRQPSAAQVSMQLPLPDKNFEASQNSDDLADLKESAKTAENTEDAESCPARMFLPGELLPSETSFVFPEVAPPDWSVNAPWVVSERARIMVSALVVELAACAESRPLVALHVTRAALLVLADAKRTKTTLSVKGFQIDNLQYETGQFDFGVVASTPTEPKEPADEERWPPLWSMLVERRAFSVNEDAARVLLQAQRDTWTVHDYQYTELTDLEISVGPLALYIEDAYVSALVELARLARAPAAGGPAAAACAELRALRAPLRLQTLLVHPLDLTLTLHTAVRMYIALDQSPLRLGAFRLQRVCTSVERLTHALTVHYLSAAILGAGWVVGGLELLGAPGALAARVGGASGGVRGVASAAAAALVRSLSAWAGSLARNLDLLAGDEEHARRAAAARRRPPPSLVAGLVAGLTNFAINILGAVGGLAHHPLVGVAVGETASGAAALRRGLLGALTKPLSATADLVAYAGHGLLTQTGWDPIPQPRESRWSGTGPVVGPVGWRRDCVRWVFRLAEQKPLAGFEVLLDGAPQQLLLTHKVLVVADPDTEKIVEMIDYRLCSIGPYQGPIIELYVDKQRRRLSKMSETPVDEDDDYQLSAAAMARVARYTGAEGGGGGGGGGGGSCGGGGGGGGGSGARVLTLLPPPGRSHALHAALAAAVHHNCDTHFQLM